jgi:hypothetical protein
MIMAGQFLTLVKPHIAINWSGRPGCDHQLMACSPFMSVHASNMRTIAQLQGTMMPSNKQDFSVERQRNPYL